MNLSDFFEVKENSTATHFWVLVSHDPSAAEDALAQELADRIVQHRCRHHIYLYSAWRNNYDNKIPPVGTVKRAIEEGFIGPVFGLPDGSIVVPPDHLEGYISQVLWYFLSLESLTEGIIRVEPPGFKVTDPGGDALVIHRTQSGYLMFRLWEIKKYTSDSPNTNLGSTVLDAYKQLQGNAIQYLARYTETGQEVTDSELQDFYGQLVDFWLNAQKEASAGVCITTSICHIPKRCFTSFGHQFPQFVDPIRLRGMLTAIGDFPAFAIKVREHIWKGL
jgi:hypothetical protein